MKRILAFSIAALLFVACGGNKSENKKSPAEDYAAACDQVKEALTQTPVDMRSLEELAKKADQIVADNKDYVMTDHDMDLITESMVETGIALYEFVVKPNAITWIGKAGQIRALKSRVKGELLRMKSFGEVESLDFNAIYGDILGN